jgi:hypothetical protein
MLLRVVIITCMISCKQSECIVIEITSGRVLTIIFYDQNTLGGAIMDNMSKPFAAVTLYVSRLAWRCSRLGGWWGTLCCWQRPSCWICGSSLRLAAIAGRRRRHRTWWRRRWGCTSIVALPWISSSCRKISLCTCVVTLHFPFSFTNKMKQTSNIWIIFILKNILNFVIQTSHKLSHRSILSFL